MSFLFPLSPSLSPLEGEREVYDAYRSLEGSLSREWERVAKPEPQA